MKKRKHIIFTNYSKKRWKRTIRRKNGKDKDSSRMF